MSGSNPFISNNNNNNNNPRRGITAMPATTRRRSTTADARPPAVMPVPAADSQQQQRRPPPTPTPSTTTDDLLQVQHQHQQQQQQQHASSSSLAPVASTTTTRTTKRKRTVSAASTDDYNDDDVAAPPVQQQQQQEPSPSDAATPIPHSVVLVYTPSNAPSLEEQMAAHSMNYVNPYLTVVPPPHHHHATIAKLQPPVSQVTTPPSHHASPTASESTASINMTSVDINSDGDQDDHLETHDNDHHHHLLHQYNNLSSSASMSMQQLMQMTQSAGLQPVGISASGPFSSSSSSSYDRGTADDADDGVEPPTSPRLFRPRVRNVNGVAPLLPPPSPPLFRPRIRKVKKRSDAPGPPRMFKCSHIGCGADFTCLGHLIRHERIHTGDRPFKCPIPGCTLTFTRADTATKHARGHIRKLKAAGEECALNTSDELDVYRYPPSSKEGKVKRPKKRRYPRSELQGDYDEESQTVKTASLQDAAAILNSSHNHRVKNPHYAGTHIMNFGGALASLYGLPPQEGPAPAAEMPMYHPFLTQSPASTVQWIPTSASFPMQSTALDQWLGASSAEPELHPAGLKYHNQFSTTSRDETLVPAGSSHDIILGLDDSADRDGDCTSSGGDGSPALIANGPPLASWYPTGTLLRADSASVAAHPIYVSSTPVGHDRQNSGASDGAAAVEFRYVPIAVDCPPMSPTTDDETTPPSARAIGNFEHLDQNGNIPLHPTMMMSALYGPVATPESSSPNTPLHQHIQHYGIRNSGYKPVTEADLAILEEFERNNHLKNLILDAHHPHNPQQHHHQHIQHHSHDHPSPTQTFLMDLLMSPPSIPEVPQIAPAAEGGASGGMDGTASGIVMPNVMFAAAGASTEDWVIG